jgi:hypothetical protein
MPVGSQEDWRFGIITREVVRLSEDSFEIHDTSGTWVSAMVDKETMTGLLIGDIQLMDIQFI